MNYRHCYHAGNFADVVKHAILIVLLEALQQKETPFCFLDTHAGIGLYELLSDEAQKKQEYRNGFEQVFKTDFSSLPACLQRYAACVQKYNTDDQLNFYPGSPFIARDFLRRQDQMILCELHQTDYATLKENLGDAPAIALHHMDAYLAMKAFLPPKLKRGLVLIDPPFEVTNEFEQIVLALHRALKHWRLGHFVIWHPIKNPVAVQEFYKKIQNLQAEKLILHFSLNEITEENKLSSCGILLINPPWQVKEILENAVLPVLSNLLNARWEFVSTTASGKLI